MPITDPTEPTRVASASTSRVIMERGVPTARRMPRGTLLRTTAAAAAFPTKNIPTSRETRLKAVRFRRKAASIRST